MKLILCPKCSDVLRLFPAETMRTCYCGQSYGRYKADGLCAEIGGEAIPLGISNTSFIKAVQQRPESGSGAVFEAFVIPRQCSTIEVLKA